MTDIPEDMRTAMAREMRETATALRHEWWPTPVTNLLVLAADAIDVLTADRAAQAERMARLEDRRVWIVGASVGRYSDRTTWTVGVWTAEDDAQAFILAIDALGREAVEAERLWLDKIEDDTEERAARDRAFDACRALDPGWSTYSCEAPIYSAWQETVRARALSQEGREPS